MTTEPTEDSVGGAAVRVGGRAGNGAAELGAAPDFRTVVERLPVVTYVTEYKERTRLRWVSPQVEALFGFPAEDWLGDSTLFSDRIHPDDR